jgi:hypothetical protein
MRVTGIRQGMGRLLACTFYGLLCFVGSAALSRADVVVDQVSNTYSNPGSQLSWSHTVGSGDDRLLLVWVAARDQDPPGSFPATIKYGNQSLKLVGSSSQGSGLVLYQVLAPTTGTHTIVVTLSTATGLKAAGAVSVTGVNPSTPLSGFIARDCPDTNCGSVIVPNGGMAIGARLTGNNCLNPSFGWARAFGNSTFGNVSFDWGSFTAAYGLGQASAESTASIAGVCPDTLVAYLAILPKNFTGFSISGKIKRNDGSPVSDHVVEIQSSSAQIGSASTDAAGNYSFVNLAHDDYILTLALSNYFTFDPPSQGPTDQMGGSTYLFNAVATNVTANFTAIPRPTFSLSGRVSREDNTAVSGVTVTAEFGGVMAQRQSVSTDAHGNYVFANLPCNITFTVEPSYTGYIFNPPYHQEGSNSPGNMTRDFTATLTTSSAAVQWTTQPNPKLNGKVGRLVVNFAKEVEYRFSGVEIYPLGGLAPIQKQFGTEREIILTPGQYDVAISNARVPQVPIAVATDTRILAGALRIQAGEKTRVEVWDAGRTKLLQWTIGNGVIGLPIGHYIIKVGKGTSAFADVIIEDGKTTDFRAP